MNVELSVRNSRLCVRTPYSAEIKDALKAIPGRLWEPEDRVWSYPLSPAAAEDVVQCMQHFGLTIVCRDDASRQLAGDAIAAASHVDPAPADHREYPAVPGETLQSFAHQRRAFWRAAEALNHGCIGGGFYLAHEMGTGKTKVVLDLIRHLRIPRALVVAPLSVVGEWPRQARTHGLNTTVLALNSGRVASKLEAIQHELRNGGNLVIVVNYESAWRQPLGSWILQQQWPLVVLDEAHKIKEGRSKVSKWAAELGQRAGRRLALSGTPAANNPLDLWSQMRFVDRGVFGDSFLRFRNEYAIMGGYQHHQVIGFRNLEQLHARFYRYADRATKEEALDLPEFMDEEMSVYLGAPAQKAYEDLETDLSARLASGEIRAANALSQLLRLQQLTGGCAALENGERLPLDSAKRRALVDLMQGLPDHEPIVVFCRFKHDIAATHEAAQTAGRQSREISGEKHELDSWRDADEEPSVIAVQIQSGGLGIDLTRACYAAFYSLGFSLAEYEQARARLHRQGQRRAVTYLHLIARRPCGRALMVDEYVYAALRKKARVVDAVIDGIATRTGGET